MSDTALPYEISPADARQYLDAGKAALLDVREPAEHALTRIEGGALIPMNTVPSRLQEIESLAAERLLVVYCHHGVRSLNVVHWLRQQGVANCVSMSGGIEDWSLSVDPSVARY
jgi:rhodanese-related sulfurtransferase